ncbi:bifunctional 2-C-methyl-D-erythritol 4-phosphate cytidylyltransferase/2-C-methyl-D-erythritol 2,4-cyclodiphosphate synthase [Sinorhizobium medicae]|uniref:Bifunctional enzyme IspD/IspF n=1 Tax=Sinorhizobium medicae TaxID=110321 RepID=A0A508WSP9_9HYPH|nr:bifunctional 2-C-methyl-D-erythritol 4-phosphate cytidylyltransferase/2-C-methyl-D-erythritol 2,4-cyclodiphosphate synthase [Sinorhizobium medicae]MDX0425497.1 bifunctional 2-C-methyl-D-erythritol 4-phosphate cytidylyltransferase/2-C-methyl-D-erythritol 2,4-cyclodiphosphate synthase [Sinorhizobium medicae]MDX0523833.1 bifunctional 2-C-methyl-D-erythritol 4-phosphate cytidylyltransferase/2-C-methyl-D-erythritol 2,4-cyclodiphosphate synthase [Sinorhizobium medicae]MDX0549737.1 bifunctional 2-C-
MQAEEQFSCGVIVVAAGRGERAGQSSEGPKQYRTVGDRPVITHTLDVFATWDGTGPVVVVIHPEDEELFASARKRMGHMLDLTVVHGGATRQLSVLAGLQAIAGAGVKHVMIHDAVRPFFDHALLDRCRAALRNGAGAVLPAVAVADTLKRAQAGGLVAETVPRTDLHAAQTPQCFRLEAILSAHRQAAASGQADFTDDASIAEWAGIPVHLVEGSPDNFKLTLRRDLSMADEKLTRMAIPDVRTGNGYDVHQLVEGDGVTLCGVFIPHDRKLSGHSDADVALHALTDALLATCGAGDIGDHFPPSDPQWKGAPSHIFLEHAARIVRERGGTITHADISLIAEAPKVGPHRQQMRESLSAMLAIAIDRCSVKATTNEKLGFVGRNEGIAAIATATVVYASGGDA